MKAGGKEKEQERARQRDKVTSCPCMVSAACLHPHGDSNGADKNATGQQPLPPPHSQLLLHTTSLSLLIYFHALLSEHALDLLPPTSA